MQSCPITLIIILIHIVEIYDIFENSSKKILFH